MGRRPIVSADGYSYQIVTRRNNKEFLFKEQEDFLTVLHVLKKYKVRYGYK